MADIFKKAKQKLRGQKVSKEQTNKMVQLMKTTCVACKHAQECVAEGRVSNPFHLKCERHELRDDIVYGNPRQQES